MQIIKRQPRKFCVVCNAETKTSLELDFSPFLRMPKSETFVILHFQGKPKFHRQWGVYSASLDQYFSREWKQLKFAKNLETHAFSLDERVYKTLPTSVLIYPESKLEVNSFSDEITILPLNQ